VTENILLIPLLGLESVKQSCVLQVKGVIFDSAPGKRSIMSLFRALTAIIGGPAYLNIPAAVLITAFLAVVWLFEVIARSLKERKPLQTDPIDLVEEPFGWPQLFLYSTADKLIHYEVRQIRISNEALYYIVQI
jgi:hypothetical protein